MMVFNMLCCYCWLLKCCINGYLELVKVKKPKCCVTIWYVISHIETFIALLVSTQSRY